MFIGAKGLGETKRSYAVQPVNRPVLSATPLNIRQIPMNLDNQRPAGTVFSINTNTASPAIQSRFINPATNNNDKSVQQHPTQ